MLSEIIREDVACTSFRVVDKHITRNMHVKQEIAKKRFLW